MPSKSASRVKTERSNWGCPVVAAVLIEPEKDPKKVLRVTLPLGMSMQPGHPGDRGQWQTHDRALRHVL